MAVAHLANLRADGATASALRRSGQARALGDRSAPKRTLTNLYNGRPTWLANAHRALDDAVAAACGWPADLIDDAILGKLLALNLEPVRATVSV